jgi:toxin ParE1/3/4
MSVRRRRSVLTLDARQELSDLLVYTEQQWGRQQRMAYKSLIQGTIRRLTHYPFLGSMRNELSSGLRSHPVGSHIIFYWVTDKELIVAHILHSRMDAESERWKKPLPPVT